MGTVLLILAVIALLCTILHLIGKCPIGVPVLLLCLIALLTYVPLGR